MPYRSSKAFSLIEVLISIGVVSVAITVIFQAFTISLRSAKYSQGLTRASFLAEDKMFEAKGASGVETIQNQQFNWQSVLTDNADFPPLKDCIVTVTWRQKNNEYSQAFKESFLPDESK